MGVGTTTSRVMSSVHSKFQEYSTWAWKLLFFIQLLVVGYLIYSLVTVLLGGGESATDFHNSYCLQNDASIQSTTLNGTVDAACAFDYNFKKVVYLWCDGISWDTAGPIFDTFTDNSNIFKVRHSFNPWSAWVFATYITGKATRNMGKIENDNLLYQFWLSGKKVYFGAEDTTAYVLNQVVLDFTKGDGSISYLPGVTSDESRMFHWLFECSTSGDPEQCTKTLLDRVKADDRSIFLESFILDHIVHGEGDKYSPGVIYLRDRLAQDIVHVKNWIDQNPEYLLVVVSDHGQKATTSEAPIHGDWLTDGNEGWVLVYNPAITSVVSTEGNPVILHTVDVAPTLTQFFSASGVSIPAESVGQLYPVSSSVMTQYKALKVNALQLRAYLKEDDTFKFNDEQWRSALNNYNNGQYEKAMLDMFVYCSDLSSKFKADSGKVPYKFPLLSLVTFFAVTLVLQFGSWQGLFATARVAGYGLLASPYIIWLVVASFFTQSSDFAPRNQVYTYAIPLTIYLASYVFKRASKARIVPQKNGHNLMHIELRENNPKIDPLGIDTDDDVHLEKGEADSLRSSSEIDIPPAEQNKQILYFEAWDYAKQKQFGESALTFIKYIIGAKDTPKISLGYWLMYTIVLYVVFSCFEIALIHKCFVWADISSLSWYPQFWKKVSYAVLLFEFRRQRVVLTSNLKLPPWKWGSLGSLLQQIAHPAFWPLNIKTVAYFILLSKTFAPDPATAVTIYKIAFAHIGLLLFMPAYIQRDLFLPVFILLSLVSGPQEKILLSFYASILQLWCNTMEKPNPYLRHALPMLAVGMISLAHYYFSVLLMLPYRLDDINLAVVGIPDVTKYPVFSVLIMGVHYLGVFVLLVPFFVRLATPAPPPLQPIKIGRFVLFGHVPAPTPVTAEEPLMTHTKRLLATFLVFCASSVTLLFFAMSISERTDTPLIWAFMINAVAGGYLATIIGHEIFDIILSTLKLVKNIITKFITPRLTL